MHTFLLSVKHTSESFEYVNLLMYSSCLHVLTLRLVGDCRPLMVGEKGLGSRLAKTTV